jgi:protein tyrosine phosphatase (PTP) superfamily phosphohydrolase (DUF442 family)
LQFTVTRYRGLNAKRLASTYAGIALVIALFETTILAQQSEFPRSKQFAPLAKKVDAPVVLCIDDKPTAGGQPSVQAYAKAAANGYRSVLTLRSAKDAVDLTRERLLAEQNQLRYFNIPSSAKLPRREQVDEFLKLVRDPANQPMLINCAFAERVAPLMMMFRIVEQGWSEDKALEEASLSGLKRDQLKAFAKEYLASPKKTRTKSTPTA